MSSPTDSPRCICRSRRTSRRELSTLPRCTYLFNDAKFDAAANPGQRRLSAQMIRYWANFAHAGDPNGDGLQHWSPFDRADAVPYVQSLAPDAVSSVDYAAEHHLDFWSQLA